MDPILITRTCFLAGVGVGIIFDAIPYLRNRYVQYGPRTKSTKQASTPLSFLDTLFSHQVPHHWFLHYYVLSVSLSLFWGYQIFTRGRLIVWLASLSDQKLEESMPIERIYLAWFLLLAQGSRRLYESVTMLKKSNSKMAFAMYLIGIVYYLLDSVGVWIEGSATLIHRAPLTWNQIGQILAFGWAPGLRLMLALPVFILASGMQNDAHRYLASLKTYTLPKHPIFHSIITPHYLMECVIYLAMAVIAAPKGQVVNKTIFTTFLFTTFNLGLVAKGTKEWSVEKFGDEAKARWRMIPYVW